MTTVPDQRDKTLGWALAGVLAIHLIVLRPPAMIGLAAFAVLVIGVLLRRAEVTLPRWLGRAALVLGAVAVFVTQGGLRSISILGSMAALLGAILLLRPITPGRGLSVLFCLLAMLVAAILKPYPTVGLTLIIIEVAALLILAEQIYRPAEVILSFWVSVMRSLRVIVPVGFVVTGVFWLFPNLSVYTAPVFSGFTGSEILNPGNISDIALSQRVALTAHFAEDQPVPAASKLYWRGQVLENNQDLRWTRFTERVERDRALQNEPPPKSRTGIFRYSQDLTSNPGGVVPVLDHAVFVEAKRSGDDVVVRDIGAAVLSAVGAGPLTMEAASSMGPLRDAPRPEIAEGSIGIPKGTRENKVIRDIARQIFSSETTTKGKLSALGLYFQQSGFEYTRRPGRIFDLQQFLVDRRRGFCEHYAAAAASLLRLSGVPTRVVTGFRGGVWNPWVRTITVRDADAHAWVEAWDESTKVWRRFDPTTFVSPGLSENIEREMDSSKWPWYRLSWSYAQAVVTQASDWTERTWEQVTSSEIWENANLILFSIFSAIALLWILRNELVRRAAGAADTAILMLAEFEHQAARFGHERHLGETPLAWLGRQQQAAREPTEKEALCDLAAHYERGVYQANSEKAELVSALRLNTRLLLKIWKSAKSAPLFGK